MLLQTNSYIVPKDKRAQHARLVQRFRQCLARLGCDHFEAYEQVGANWSPADTTGRFVQLMRFRDRKHQLAVQASERSDATAQGLIKEFCELINFPYQQQQGLFAVGFYHSLLPTITPRATSDAGAEESEELEAVEDGDAPSSVELQAEPGQPPKTPTTAMPTSISGHTEHTETDTKRETEPESETDFDDLALLDEIEPEETELPVEPSELSDEGDEPSAPGEIGAKPRR